MTAFRNGSNFLSNVPPVTKNLILINLVCWLASLLYPSLHNFLGLHFIKATDFRIHQLVTYMFMHSRSGLGHVFFNMFAVYMFGRILEQVWGPKRFLIFYMVTGIGAGIVQEITWFIELKPLMDGVNNYIFNDEIGILGQYFNFHPSVSYPAEVVLEAQANLLNRYLTVGASGAVFGILLGFGMLFPNAPIYLLFIPVPIKAKWMVIGYGVLELFAGVSGHADNVAHFAHLGGMIFGYFLIVYWRKKGYGNGVFLG